MRCRTRLGGANTTASGMGECSSCCGEQRRAAEVTERDSNADIHLGTRKASCCRSRSEFPRTCAIPGFECAGVPSHPIFSARERNIAPPNHDAMPSFFDFQLGSDSNALETESLRYGRFRALQVPKRSVGELFSAFGLNADDLRAPTWTGGGARGYGYGSININTRGDAEEGEEGEEEERWWLDKMLISPRRRRVVKLVDQWWGRLWLLVVLPAAIVSPLVPHWFRYDCG